MKKKAFKTLSVLLAVLMVVTSIPFANAAIFTRVEDDVAYLSEFGLTPSDKTESGYSIKTGNAPWDADDSRGNDSSPNNNVVRTFDTITYETFFTTSLAPQGQSIKTFTCEDCGGQYVSNVTLNSHEFGRWVTNSDGTHTRVCLRDPAHTETKDCDFDDIDPELTDDGYLQFTCGDCGYTYVDTSVQFDPDDTGIAAHDLGDENDEPAHTHIYNVIWTWAADNSSAEGAVTCTGCEFEDSITVDSTVVTVQTPGCTKEGLKKYTVTSDEYSATDSKTVKYADATGHTYNVVWDWAADNSSATGAVTCEACDFTASVTVDSKSEPVQTPDCTNEGLMKYTVASDEYDATDSKTVKYADAKGHTYNVEWSWESDYSGATAIVTCSDCTFGDLVYVDSIEENLQYPSCTDRGSAKYTVTTDLYGATDTKTVSYGEILEHSYVDTWEWTADGSFATVTVTCPDCDFKETTDECTYTNDVTTFATCTEKGTTTYYAKAVVNGKTFTSSKAVVNIAAEGHSYVDTWTWAEDGSAASVKVTCSKCDLKETADADEITSEVTTDQTCTEMGKTTYTAKATVAGKTYISTKTVTDVPADGHDYTDTWEWEADGSAATVTVTCTKCDFEQTADADEITSGVTTVQTCTNKGKTTYTATVTVAGETYTSTKTVTDIPADGHDYVDTWTWAEDGSEASVTVTCTKCDLEVTVDGDITSEEKTKDQTCTVKGETTYTATATADEHLFADSKTVADIPADGHDYIDTWTWAEDGSAATVTVTCSKGDFEETADADEITSEVTTDQTCTDHGETTYSAKATVDGKKFTSEKKIFDVIPDGHTYVPTWDWADDGKSVTLTVNCTKDDFEETVVLEGSDVASEVSKVQTCTEKGDTTYSVSVVVAGETYESSKTVTDIEPDGHTYISEWDWADDGKNATLTVTCEKGDFNEVVPVVTTGDVTTDPLCTVKGYTTYTAVAEVAGITYTDTLTLQDVPELTHDYVLINAEDETCTAPSMEYYECSRCDSTKTTHDIPEKGHDFNGVYKYDAATKTHTRLCLNDCGTYGDEKVCRFDDGVISYDASHLSVDEYADGYKNGTVYFEYILPCTSKEAIFEMGSMGWLVTSREATYEIVEEEIEFNGELVTAQILRGSILLTPNKNNASAIGASYNTLPVAVRIMDMKNGTQFAPAFTMWMGGNDVNTTYKGKYGGIPTSIVYGSDYLCPAHDRYEYESFTAPSVEVTAAPSYNVQLKKGTHANNTSIGSYDFTTGNELAQNKDAGVVDGRMYGFGLTLQLYGKSADKGMMGVELPDGSPITFDLKLDTAYTAAGAEVEKGYQALLWSGDANADRANADGRDNMTATNYMLGVAPLNESKNPDKYNLTNDYNRCKDGGNWSFVVDEADPSIIHVTVTDYVADLTCLPYANTNETASTSKTYYNYKTVGTQYWKIQQACISAGEVWVVQPYKNYDETSENYGKHIVDVYGSGTVRTTLTDVNLDMTGISGTSTIDEGIGQALTTDDMGMFDYVYVRPGSRTTYIRYTKYNSPSTSLTTGCEYSNGDWGVSGQKIAIYGVTESAGSEGDNAAVATSNLIKFDDKFFIPESSSVTAQTSTAAHTPNRNAYWGAKPDKTGWDHNGLMPDEDGYDDDMLRTTADDLIWFSSLEELKEQGYVAVAVIYEQIGLTNSSKYGGYNSVSHYVRGSIDKTCPVNYAYMTAVEGYIWSKTDVAAEVMEYFGLDNAEDITDEMYSAYVKSDKFFTRANNEKLADNANQPGYIYNSATNSGFFNTNVVQKAVYEDFEYKTGAGAPYYIDSCYAIPFSSKITANIVQDNEDGTDKKIYDMGQNQRVVDYVLNPHIVCEVNTTSDNVDTTVTTTVTVTSTLPKGLTYIMGSSFYDPTETATYKQDDTYQVPGTIKGALDKAPVATVNADGTTTLVWTFKDTEIDPNEKVTDLGFIYYSAKIGTPENEATDVVNQQQLTTTVKIEADLDVCREFDLAVGNYAEVPLEVLKLTAFSFTKVADCDVVDAGEPIGYTITAGNNAATSVKDSIMVESLPYDGDAKGSHFRGEAYVTKFAAASVDKVYRDFEYFYTTNKMYRDYTGMEFVEEGYTRDDFEASEDWTLLTLSDGDLQKGLFTDFPSVEEQKGEGQIVCIVVVGHLHPQETLMFRVEISAPELHAQDKLVNSFSRDKLAVESSVVVVKREISGHAWVDRNPDGSKEHHEEFLSDVEVTLLRKDEDGNLVPVTYTDKDGNVVEAKVPTGKTLNLITGEITDAKDEGSYSFIGVPEGNFSVTFDGGNRIDDIVMPSAREIKNSEVHVDPDNNMGLTLTSVTTNITWDDLDDLDKLRKPYGVTLYANGQPYGEEIFSDGINELTYTWDELPMCSNGEIIEYKVVVTTLPEGYETVYTGHDIALTRNPALYLLPVVFFAPDNIGFLLADGIEYYYSIEGNNKRVSNNTFFNDSTTIYVVRGTRISFKPATIFLSYQGGYATSLKSGTDPVTSLPQIIEADEDGFFNFRVYDSYNFVSLVQVMKDPETGESVPWWTVVINLIKKFIAFLQRLFKF